VQRIALTHAVENSASCRVAYKSGFRLEELLPANKRFGDGVIHDEHLHVRDGVGEPDVGTRHGIRPLGS
jgi:RimJ/RimL family protein N-acetyltransferase